MSFLLQGNARSLRFDDEVKPAQPSNPGALGKPRIRKPPPPPKAPAPQPTTRMGEAPVAPIRTPQPFAARIATPIPGLREARSDYRAPADSFSDEQPTMALDRELREVLPGASRPAPKPMPAAGRPIPNFRPPAPTQLPSVVVARDTGSSAQVSSRPGAAWLVWLVASAVLGVASYHYAPGLLAKYTHRGTPNAHVVAAKK